MYGMNRTDLSSEQKSKKIQGFLDLATQHHKAGNLPKAKGIYRKILQETQVLNLLELQQFLVVALLV